MSRAVALANVTRRRRQVLYLRAYGHSYEEIAERLGISVNLVHKDLISVARAIVPKSGKDAPATRQPQVFYVLGLLDGGVAPEDVLAYLDSLPDRVAWLAARIDREARREEQDGMAS